MSAKPILKPMQVRIPDSARNWLKQQARAEGRSMNFVLNRVLERAQKQEMQHGLRANSAAFKRFMAAVFKPGAVTCGDRQIDVARLDDIQPLLLRSMDNLESEWLTWLESGFLGVEWGGGGWQARIRIGDGRRLSLGTFSDPEEAHQALPNRKTPPSRRLHDIAASVQPAKPPIEAVFSFSPVS